MKTIQINLEKIAQLCQKLGYSAVEVEAFKKKFAETFLFNLGRRIEKQLTSAEKDKLNKLLADKKTILSDLVSSLKTLGLEEKTKKISQTTFDQMIITALERLAILTTDQQYELMKKELLKD